MSRAKTSSGLTARGRIFWSLANWMIASRAFRFRATPFGSGSSPTMLRRCASAWASADRVAGESSCFRKAAFASLNAPKMRGASVGSACSSESFTTTVWLMG